MRRFLMQANKLARVGTITTTGTASTTVDTFVDAAGYENICALVRCDSTSSDPTVNLKLMAATVTGGTGATTVCSTSWTAGTTGDIGALQAAVNAAGETYRYFAVKLTTNPGAADKVKARILYFLGGARRKPVTVNTTTTGAGYHMTAVKATTVDTA